MPTSMAISLLSKSNNTFLDSDELSIGHFSHQLTIHPALPVLLTKTRPTKELYFIKEFSKEILLFCLFKV